MNDERGWVLFLEVLVFAIGGALIASELGWKVALGVMCIAGVVG